MNVVRNTWISWGWVAFPLWAAGSFEVVIGWECEENTVGLSCLSRCGLNAVLRWWRECARIP